MGKHCERPGSVGVGFLLLLDPIVPLLQFGDQIAKPIRPLNIDGYLANPEYFREALLVVLHHIVESSDILVPKRHDLPWPTSRIHKSVAARKANNRLHERMVRLPRFIVEATQVRIRLDDKKKPFAVVVAEINRDVVCNDGWIPRPIIVFAPAFLQDKSQ